MCVDAAYPSTAKSKMTDCHSNSDIKQMCYTNGLRLKHCDQAKIRVQGEQVHLFWSMSCYMSLYFWK